MRQRYRATGYRGIRQHGLVLFRSPLRNPRCDRYDVFGAAINRLYKSRGRADYDSAAEPDISEAIDRKSVRSSAHLWTTRDAIARSIWESNQ